MVTIWKQRNVKCNGVQMAQTQTEVYSRNTCLIHAVTREASFFGFDIP